MAWNTWSAIVNSFLIHFMNNLSLCSLLCSFQYICLLCFLYLKKNKKKQKQRREPHTLVFCTSYVRSNYQQKYICMEFLYQINFFFLKKNSLIRQCFNSLNSVMIVDHILKLSLPCLLLEWHEKFPSTSLLSPKGHFSCSFLCPAWPLTLPNSAVSMDFWI